MLVLVLLIMLPPAANADRLALVIGNADFERSTDLPQTAEDARAMATKLNSLDFRLIGGKAHINLSRAEMLRQVRALGREASAGDEVVFYFSGHGIGGTQTNYLLPVNDGEIETREDVPDLAIDVASILDRLPKGDAGANIFILDACRDNPLPSRAKSAFTQKGLTRLSNGTSNTVFLYAAEPGERAYVSNSGRSFFTDALLSALDVPGENLTDLMRRVRLRVAADTREEAIPQIPWLEGFTSRPFYFRQAPTAAIEAEAWQAAQEDGTVPALLKFLTQHPDGQYADQAQTLITMKSGFVTRAVANRAVSRDVPSTASESVSRNPGESFSDCDGCPEMVVIPSGSFVLGSRLDELGRAGDEGPARTVNIGYQLAIGKYEVTWDEWDMCVSDGGCDRYGPEIREREQDSWGKGPRPVIFATWFDAQNYAFWLSRKTGHRYRLLSEAEWEFAVKYNDPAGKSTGTDSNGGCPFNSNGSVTEQPGDSMFVSGEREVCDDGFAFTAPVGSYEPNALGLHDMYGNVSEWLADCYTATYDNAPTDGRAKEIEDCSQRVLRGGNWYNPPSFFRASRRDQDMPSEFRDTYGFRVARELN